jgi:hypothetical protein
MVKKTLTAMQKKAFKEGFKGIRSSRLKKNMKWYTPLGKKAIKYVISTRKKK